MPCPENDEISATVTGFSKTGELVFTTAKHYGTITFKIDLAVWSGNRIPQVGEIVILSGIAKFSKGWRADRARQFKLADGNQNLE